MGFQPLRPGNHGEGEVLICAAVFIANGFPEFEPPGTICATNAHLNTELAKHGLIPCLQHIDRKENNNKNLAEGNSWQDAARANRKLCRT
jgi:hypothetical protein